MLGARRAPPHERGLLAQVHRVARDPGSEHAVAYASALREET